MDQDANYAITGVFVIVLTIVLIFAIIWLSSGLSFARNKIYEVNMQEAVSGLNLNAAVEYNGVNVGKVSSIKIDNANPKSVQLLLNIRSDTPITVGTRARLNSRGVTGISYISLEDDGGNTKKLSVLPHHEYPSIQTNPSIFSQWDATLNRLTKSVSKVSISIQKLLNPENLKYITQTLKQADYFSRMLAINSNKMSDVIKRSDDILQILQQETLPATNQLMNQLNQSSNSFSELSEEIKRNPAVLLRGQEPKPAGPGE